MRAVDTNVVVRYLTGDHPEQAARARTAIDGGPVFASTTVMLESEWVLRSVYGFGGTEVVALRSVSGMAVSKGLARRRMAPARKLLERCGRNPADVHLRAAR